MNRIASKLLRWYKAHGRKLPWRGHPDSYAVWVSEIMLQQTRVESVIPYFNAWMNRFPTVKELADASEQDVLNHWEGLGYYSRARNLHKAAGIVMNEFGGKLPRSRDALRRLPGIGRYTAGAIASFAFGLDEPTLDSNLRRVFARLLNLEVVADSGEGEKILWAVAAEILPKGRAGAFNQAMMDLGSTICLPKKPLCQQCPLQEECQARKKGVQDARPILKPKVDVPTIQQVSVVVVRRGRVLLAKRPPKGLLGGMWEFPNGQMKGKPARGLVKAMDAYGLPILSGEWVGVIRHAYSHFRVIVHVFRAELNSPLTNVKKSDRANKGIKWVKLSDLENLPMGKIDRQIAQQITEGNTE